MSRIKSLRKSLSTTARNAREKTQHNLIKAGRTTIIRLQSLLPPRIKKSNATDNINVEPELAEIVQDHKSQATVEDLSVINDKEMNVVDHNVCQTMVIVEDKDISDDETNTSHVNEMPAPDRFFYHTQQNGSTASSDTEERTKISAENSAATSMIGNSDHPGLNEKMQQDTQNDTPTSQGELYETSLPISAGMLQAFSNPGPYVTHSDDSDSLPSSSDSYSRTFSSQFTADTVGTVEHEQKHDALTETHASVGQDEGNDTPMTEELELMPTVSVLGQDNETDTEDGQSESSDDEDEDDDDDDDLEKFQALIDAVNLPALTQLAINLRQQLLSKEHSTTVVESCEIIGEPACGSYNLVYTLQFDDGVKWIARIPGYGINPTKEYVTKMQSEYNTMRYIASKTTFKLPNVFYWTTDPSIIGAAFGLISCIEGVPLWNLWTDKDFSDEQRQLILFDVAVEMTKLFTLQFPKTGTLRFDDFGNIEDIDHEIEYREDGVSPWHATYLQRPFGSTSEWFANRKSSLERNYNLFAKRRPAESLLRVVIGTMPQVLREAPLSLSLADADAQNIFCDPVTGRLTGFIDMDNIHVAPVTIGSAAYPLFLLRDRDPSIWMRDINHDLPDIPYEQFRKHYATAFEAAVEKTHLPFNSNWTRLSHHTGMIERAMMFYSWRQKDIVERMVFRAYYNAYQDSCYSYEDLQSRIKTDFKPFAYKSRQRLRRTVENGMWVEEDTPAKHPPAVQEYLDRRNAERAAEAAEVVQVADIENVVTDVSTTNENHDNISNTSEDIELLEAVNCHREMAQHQPIDKKAAESPASQVREPATTRISEETSSMISAISAHDILASNAEKISQRKELRFCGISKTCEEFCWKVCRETWYMFDKIMMPIWQLLD